MNSEILVQLIGATETININDGTSGFYLDEEISGLELPEKRISSANYSGRNGGYIGAQFFGMRELSLTGRTFSTDVTTTYALRRQLQALLAEENLIVRIVTADGYAYIADCTMTRMTMPIRGDTNWAYFKIDLLCPDSVLYDDTAGGLLEATVNRTVQAGFTWPITWPIDWGTNSGPTTVTNTGTTTVFPLITLTGVGSDPVLTNTTTSQVWEIDALTTVSGDVVVIDMKDRTVTINGGNIFYKVPTTAQWWGLIPGANSISLDTSGGSDTMTASISWRGGVMGV